MAIAQQPDSRMLDVILEALDLAPEQAALLEQETNRLKDVYVDTLSRPTLDGGPSPMKRLAAWTKADYPNAIELFMDYSRTAHEPRTGIPYLMVVAEAEKEIRAGLSSHLPAKALADLADRVQSLLEIDTGHDPMQAAVSSFLEDPAFDAEEVLKATHKFEGFFCQAPFEFAVVDDEGSVYVCCPGWLRTPIGNLATHSWDEVWNSSTAAELRESIHDGSYRFCNPAICPHLSGQGGRLLRNEEVSNPRHREIIDQRLTRIEANPQDITIQYDPTCNLTCPSCRCGVFKADGEKSAQIKNIHERVWSDMIAGARRLTVAGNGDPFASKLYVQALREFDPARFPDLRIAFITNGLLLTPEMWESIANCHPAIESVNVSFNAATAPTFAINQRGGDFKKLLKNFEHLAELRQRGEIPILGIGFVVQANNVHEMKEAVRLAHQFKVDRILFGKLTMPSYLNEDHDAFRAMAIHLPEHPRHHELLEVLSDPVFLDPVVQMTNLTPLMPGYRPHVGEGGATRESMPLREVMDLLALDPVQCAGFETHLMNFAREYIRLMCIRPAQTGDAPAERLGRALAAPGAAPEAALADFQSYGGVTIEPHTGRSYLFIAREMERETRRQFNALLDAEQRNALARLPIPSLTHIEEVREKFFAACASGPFFRPPAAAMPPR